MTGNDSKGFTVWVMGLSASGKSTVTEHLFEMLRERIDKRTYVMDGDYMRATINRDLGYERAERNEASERMAYVARILNDNGVVCLVSNISQDREIRQRIREIIGDFHLIFLDTHIDVCRERDYKGNYEKAHRGELKNFVGYDEKFEPPCPVKEADLTIDNAKLPPERSAQLILEYLEGQGLLTRKS